MKTALKNFFNHPLMAPITDTVKSSARPLVSLYRDIGTSVVDNFKKSRQAGHGFLRSLAAGYTGFFEIEDKKGENTGYNVISSASLLASPFLYMCLAFWEPTAITLANMALLGGTLAGGVAFAPFLFTIPLCTGFCAAVGMASGATALLGGCEKAVTFAFNGRAKYDVIMAARQAKQTKQNPRNKTATPAKPAPSEVDDIITRTENLSPEERQKLARAMADKFSKDFSGIAKTEPARAANQETAPIPSIQKKPFNRPTAR